jgi:hypothetical protein
MDKSELRSTDLKHMAACWLRYNRQCPIVALEANCLLDSFSTGGMADLLAIGTHRQLIEVEVKISIADFHKDQEKEKHQAYRKMKKLEYHQIGESYFGGRRLKEPAEYPTNLFYFAVPYELGRQVAAECDELYPYAGVLGFRKVQYYWLPSVRSFRKAKQLSKKKLSLLQIAHLAKEQSATLCRLLGKLAEK